MPPISHLQAAAAGRKALNDKKRKEEKSLPVSGCRHILGSGSRCDAPTSGGVAYCETHSGAKQTPTKLYRNDVSSRKWIY